MMTEAPSGIPFTALVIHPSDVQHKIPPLRPYCKNLKCGEESCSPRSLRPAGSQLSTSEATRRVQAAILKVEDVADKMIRKLKSGEYRLYSRKKNAKTGKRRNLGTFSTLKKAKDHERAVQYFKRH
jgi:hypothetical protein